MTLATVVQGLTEFAQGIEEDYGSPESFVGPEPLAIVLKAIADCRRELANFYKVVEADLMARAGQKRFVVEGLGEVTISRSTKRTEWENNGLTRQLVAHALDERRLDEETGEYEPAHEAVARVLSECARPSWRTTALRAHGIQVDEWCHEEPEAYNVRLP